MDAQPESPKDITLAAIEAVRSAFMEGRGGNATIADLADWQSSAAKRRLTDLSRRAITVFTSEEP